MDIESCAIFFVGSMLLMLGVITIVAGIVVINNVLHRYWKPVSIFTPDSWRGFFPPPHPPFVEMTAPRFQEPEVKKTTGELNKTTAVDK